MIDLRDGRRLVVDLLVAELLTRPGRPGPLARPRWRRFVAPPPPVPLVPGEARGETPPQAGRR